MADPSFGAAALTRAELREELDRSLAHYATKQDLADQRAEVMTEIANLRGEMKAEIANLRADLIKWMIGLMLGSVTTAVAIAVAVDRFAG
ncbi:MAG: hypothetical protein F4Y02_16355 [Chloroflexi bacterium]|nr:hypothetical protein [Chloroflexota bacterium]